MEDTGFLELINKHGSSLEWLDASNCQDALTDESVQAIANIENPKLTYLNLSYAKLITDEGLNAFEGKEFMLDTLNLTGLTGVSGKGLYHPIWACKETLSEYFGGLMDQEEVKPGMDMKALEFGKALGNCWNLQILDLGFNKALTDAFFEQLMSQEKTDDEGLKWKVGLKNLHSCKLNYL